MSDYLYLIYAMFTLNCLLTLRLWMLLSNFSINFVLLAEYI
jgi:hypothetical protein